MQAPNLVFEGGFTPLLSQYRFAAVSGTVTMAVRLVAADGRTRKDTLTIGGVTDVENASSLVDYTNTEWVGMEIISVSSDCYYTVWSQAGAGETPASGDARIQAGTYVYAPITVGVVG